MPFKGCKINFVAFIPFLMENPVSENIDPDQTPYYTASDLGLHCLPMTLLRVSRVIARTGVRSEGPGFL